jgi:hypothetical protein
MDLEEFDRDAEVQSEARVVNVTDDVVRFEIATQPGSKPRRYKLSPHGRTESAVFIQEPYTRPYKGVGRGLIPATIETLTEREAYPAGPLGPPGMDGIRRPVYDAGPRLPCVVHEERAAEVRALWVKAMAQRPSGAPRVVIQTSAGPMEARLAPAGRGNEVDDAEDEEDMTLPEGEGLDDLPEVPEPVIPTAPVTKGKGGRKQAEAR